MSGQQSYANEGQALCLEDRNAADADAAGMDDRVTELMFLPGQIASPPTFTKRVVALGVAVPGYLCYPDNLTQGAILVQSAWYAVANTNGSNMSVPRILLAGTCYVQQSTPQVSTNLSGATVYQAVYAILQRVPTVTVARLTRDANDTAGSNLFKLADAPKVAVALTTAQTSRTNALNAVPPDDTTNGIYYFFLGFVVVANGYTLGNAIAASNDGAATFLENAWAAGGISQQMLRGNVGTILAHGADAHTPSELANKLYPGGVSEHRLAATQQMFVSFLNLHSDASGNAPLIPLDDTQDWRRRVVKIEGYRLGTSGHAHPTPDKDSDQAPTNANLTTFSLGPFPTTVAGGTSGPMAVLTGVGNGGTDVTFMFFAYPPRQGSLYLVIGNNVNGNGGDPDDTTNGDAWNLLITYTDQIGV